MNMALNTNKELKLYYSRITSYNVCYTKLLRTGDYKCDFISYYPYQKVGIKAGKSEIGVSVNKDQTSTGSFSSSDFLVASQKNIITSTAPVDLNYKHIFCKIKIKLKLSGNDSPSSILTKNPIIQINHLNTKSSYNRNNFV